MKGANQTAVTEYVLLGPHKHCNLEVLLSVFCLGIDSMNVLGNALLIGLNVLHPHLHNPMYFFLSNLSLMDICGTSSFVPLMLVNFLETRRTISFPGCALQMYLTLALGSTECLLLAVMAYDHYVAICQPLRYPELMSGQTCMRMAVLSWGTGFANSLLQSILVWRLPFCGHNVINYFFCEILAVLKLACGDISLNALALMVATHWPPSCSSACLTFSSWSPSLGYPLLQAGTKPSPPAQPTSQWWWFFMGQSPSCTSNPRPRTPTWIRLSHCSMGL